MRISRYAIKTHKISGRVRLAVVSDLHSRPYENVLSALKTICPDAVLLPGDIVEIAAGHMDKRNQAGLSFLRKATEIAPCYYCYGNHEIYYSHARGGNTKRPESHMSEDYMKRILSYGVHVINDSCESISLENGEEISVGGLVCGRDMDPETDSEDFDSEFLKSFDKKESFKILLCHYPHYYEKYLKETAVDLILSGHAHGGQWRIFGRGVYAPHQGLFPKFTSGIHDGRHIISRGAVNNAKPIPRFFNPCEVLEITVN